MLSPTLNAFGPAVPPVNDTSKPNPVFCTATVVIAPGVIANVLALKSYPEPK